MTEDELEPAAYLKVWQPSGLIEESIVPDQSRFQTEEFNREDSGELTKEPCFAGRDIIKHLESFFEEWIRERMDRPEDLKDLEMSPEKAFAVEQFAKDLKSEFEECVKGDGK